MCGRQMQCSMVRGPDSGCQASSGQLYRSLISLLCFEGELSPEYPPAYVFVDVISKTVTLFWEMGHGI